MFATCNICRHEPSNMKFFNYIIDNIINKMTQHLMQLLLKNLFVI